LHTGCVDNGSLIRASKRCLSNNHKSQHRHHGFRFLRDQKGSIDFLIVITLVIFLVFICVDFFTLFANYQIAKHVSYYYLERVRVEGRLTENDETAMTAKYASAKMTVENIVCTNGANNARQSTGGNTIIKDPVSADSSKLELKITVKPEIKPLLSALLIGASPVGNDFRIKVGGTVLSEKI
jgi:Flp pilus assembly protein TadG